MNRRLRMIGWSVAAIAALLAAAAIIYRTTRLAAPAQPVEKLVLAVPTQPAVANVWIAHAQGFFLEQGLEVTLQPFATGKQALASAVAGSADVAVVADTPIVHAVLQGQPIAILATLYQSGRYMGTVARKDRGIRGVPDLKGKRIGAAVGTNAELFQDTLLALHGIDRNDVQRADVGPGGVFDALVKGEVDAVTTWEPHTNLLRAHLGDAAITFNDQAIYTMTFNLVSLKAWSARRPETTKRVLRALIETEAFIKAHPHEAIAITSRALDLTPALLKEIIRPDDFTVTVTHSLLVTLEDQTRWAMQHGLTQTKQMPNYLEFMALDGLSALRPRSITLIQ